MEHAPVYIVDSSLVRREDHERFLKLVHEEFVPILSDAGAELLSVLATSPEIGEDVEVQVTWKIPDHSVWNVTRKNYFMDPRYHSASATAANLRVGGKRRFFYPA